LLLLQPSGCAISSSCTPTTWAVVKRLLDYAERARDDLGDSLTKRAGKNVRPAGRM
jgi:hypothetical protein